MEAGRVERSAAGERTGSIGGPDIDLFLIDTWK